MNSDFFSHLNFKVKKIAIESWLDPFYRGLGWVKLPLPLNRSFAHTPPLTRPPFEKELITECLYLGLKSVVVIFWNILFFGKKRNFCYFVTFLNFAVKLSNFRSSIQFIQLIPISEAIKKIIVILLKYTFFGGRGVQLLSLFFKNITRSIFSLSRDGLARGAGPRSRSRPTAFWAKCKNNNLC